MERIRLYKARKFFWLMALGGIFCIFCGLAGLDCDTILERIAAILLGMSILAGFGGTLLLSYNEVSENNRFTVQVIVRVGFMAIAPTLCLYSLTASYTRIIIDMELIFRLILASSLTVVPFGISLLWLIWMKKRGGR